MWYYLNRYQLAISAFKPQEVIWEVQIELITNGIP